MGDCWKIGYFLIVKWVVRALSHHTEILLFFYLSFFHDPDELLNFSIGSLPFYAYLLVPGSINLQGLMWYAKISTENINEIKLYQEQFMKILISKKLHNFPKWFINVKIGIFIISVNFERVDMN